MRHLYTMKRAAARLQHLATGEPQPGGYGPHRLDQRGIGVVGVQGAARGRSQCLFVQHVGELGVSPGELLPLGVEDLGDRAPARPAGQDALLLRRGRARLLLDGAQRGQRGQVRADPGHAARWRQIRLAGGPEDGRRGGYGCAGGPGGSSSVPGSGSSSTMSASTISSA